MDTINSFIDEPPHMIPKFGPHLRAQPAPINLYTPVFANWNEYNFTSWNVLILGVFDVLHYPFIPFRMEGHFMNGGEQD